MLKKDLPTRINLTDGTGASGPSTITVYANPIIAQTRINLGGEVATLVPIPVPGYPASQTHRYIPANVSGLTWYNAIGSDNIALTNTVFSNNELVFNGSSSRGLWSKAIIPATGDWSLSFYIKTNTFDSTRTIFCQDTGSIGRLTFFFANPDLMLLDLATTTSPGHLQIRPSGYSVNTYYYIVFTRQGDLFSAYVNNILVGSGTRVGELIAQPAQSAIGVYNRSNIYYLSGAMKYVGVCVGTAMTVAEIESEYNQMAYL